MRGPRASRDGRRRLLGLLLGLLLGPVPLPGTAAAGPEASSPPAGPPPRSLVIESFAVDLRVREDGELEVVETIRLRFTGAWNGIYRTIPVDYRTPHGFRYELILDVEGVTDGAGTPLRHETRLEDGLLELKIRVPGARDATRTVVARYRVENGLRFFDDHDELYWNATGAGWDVPIEEARARIELPPGVRGVRARAGAGAYGSPAAGATAEVDGNVVRAAADAGLGIREGLTVAVAWEPGVVSRPTAMDHAGRFLGANWIFGIPLLVLAGMSGLWHVRGRDPGRRPVVARYTAPEDLTPAEVGTLVDNRPHLRDITATIIDLAIRGHLRIEETGEPGFVVGPLEFGSSTGYALVRETEPEAWEELRRHEETILDALFDRGGRERVELSELENEFYRALPEIESDIFRRLVDLGLYRERPDRVARRYVVTGFVLLAAAPVLGGTSAGGLLGQPALPVVVAGVLTGAIVLVFGVIMPSRTVRGTRVLEEVLGFEEFLERVESDRFRRVMKTPEMFEENLPHAMALGVERAWARAFGDIYRTPPGWYGGADPGSFRAGDFVGSLRGLSTRAGSALSSSPRSSGSSGFGGGGGGFGGGGFGGGGGGGF